MKRKQANKTVAFALLTLTLCVLAMSYTTAFATTESGWQNNSFLELTNGTTFTYDTTFTLPQDAEIVMTVRTTDSQPVYENIALIATKPTQTTTYNNTIFVVFPVSTVLVINGTQYFQLSNIPQDTYVYVTLKYSANGETIAFYESTTQFKTVGYEIISNESYQQGYNDGYIQGKSEYKGLYTGILAISDGMFNIVQKMLNWEFFGVNVANFFFSIITLLVVGFVIKGVIKLA